MWRELLLLFKLSEDLFGINLTMFGDETDRVDFKALLSFAIQDGLSKEYYSRWSLDSLPEDDFSGQVYFLG
jgi:hypothetical protein